MALPILPEELRSEVGRKRSVSNAFACAFLGGPPMTLVITQASPKLTLKIPKRKQNTPTYILALTASIVRVK